jgi:tRNA(fMet)-specific endonuclease VapC
VLIDAERSGAPLDELIGDDDDVTIAAITAAELLVGVERASPKRRAARASYVERVLSTIPVDGYDLDVARIHATLLAATQRSGKPRGAHDLMIAATAAAKNRIIVSADGGAFIGLDGVSVRV